MADSPNLATRFLSLLSIPNSVFFCLSFRMRIYAELLYLVLAAATVAGDKSRSSGKKTLFSIQ